MRSRKVKSHIICLSLPFLLVLCAATLAQEADVSSVPVKIPIGTKVYCELTERVVSKKSEFQVGDKVDVRVWRDVVVDGQVVIPRGAPVDARVSLLKSAKIAGVQGRLEIEAKSLAIASGKEIPLSGGYGKHASGRKAVAISLSAVVAWPLIFITGKKAVLEPGTVFDAYIDQEVVVEVPAKTKLPTISLAALVTPALEVEVLYDEMTGDKVEVLPMRLTIPGEPPSDPFVIDRVNGAPVEEPIGVEMGPFEVIDGKQTARGTVPLKTLGKVFRRGINRFEVAYGKGDARVSTEVLLDIQF